MKIRILAAIAVLVCLPCACSRSTPTYAAPKSLKSQFPDQFARLDYYAQNFTKLINEVPFPPVGADEIDKVLFQVPSILSVSVFNESTSMGMRRDSWARESLQGKSFWLSPDAKQKPRVAIGKGRTGDGKEFDIVDYTDSVVEPRTGNLIRVTIDFDLTELKKQAEQAGTGPPATRHESKSEGKKKPQPEAEE